MVTLIVYTLNDSPNNTETKSKSNNTITVYKRAVCECVFYESPCIIVLYVSAVRKRELGASCGMNDICRDDNAHCTTSTSSGPSTCQCTDTFYKTVEAICSMYCIYQWFSHLFNYTCSYTYF